MQIPLASTLPWVPEPPVIEVRTRRGGSGHTSNKPHFGEFNIWTLFMIGLNLCESFHWLTDTHKLTGRMNKFRPMINRVQILKSSKWGWMLVWPESPRRVLTSITRGSGIQGTLGNKHYCKLIIVIYSFPNRFDIFYKWLITCEIRILNLMKRGSRICNRCDQRLFILASRFFRLTKSLWNQGSR
jgi:hypothetical protein